MARALEQLLATTLDDSYEQLEPRFKKLEKQLLAAAASDFERTEIQRRIAERLFSEAFARNCPWPIFSRPLRRLQRLGYSNLERRYHVVTFYALWCGRQPDHDSREARRLLEDLEGRIRRLPRGGRLRRGLSKGLEEVRAQAGFIPSSN
ncbi:hypothetical protein [Hyalangium gracile]|uniref:hypothetical protein n=1 Tax=Hyalangium gracile TaxID=394092 RepID=UPI001CCDA447|nr:hypothetical protein [Hyalangium gracile]